MQLNILVSEYRTTRRWYEPIYYVYMVLLMLYTIHTDDKMNTHLHIEIVIASANISKIGTRIVIYNMHKYTTILSYLSYRMDIEQILDYKMVRSIVTVLPKDNKI